MDFLPTRPLPYKQLIWRSMVLYRASFSKILPFAALLSLIVFIPRILADAIGQNIFAALAPFSPHRLWLIAIDIVALIFFVAILWHMYCVMRKKHEPFIEDFTVGARKALSVFVAVILQGIIVLAFVILIYALLYLLHRLQLLFINSLPGIILTTLVFFGQLILLMYVSTLFIFIIPLIAIENNGVFRAIEHSVLLVWNHWWRVFSTQITPWISYTILLIVIKYLLSIDIHIYFTRKTNFGIWITILNIILFTLFIPWVAALLLTQLKDLELRKKLAPKRRSKRR